MTLSGRKSTVPPSRSINQPSTSVAEAIGSLHSPLTTISEVCDRLARLRSEVSGAAHPRLVGESSVSEENEPRTLIASLDNHREHLEHLCAVLLTELKGLEAGLMGNHDEA